MQTTRLRVAGALLVAVPDPAGRQFPAAAIGFAPVPPGPMPCPSLVVASRDDPYASIEYARQRADSWRSRLVDIGEAGHINAASGLGDWSAGHDLLSSLAS
jgi:predicted alpha/beta hydrolase family esterase